MELDKEVLKSFIIKDRALLVVCYDFLKLKSYLGSLGLEYPSKLFSSHYLYVPEILQGIYAHRKSQDNSKLLIEVLKPLASEEFMLTDTPSFLVLLSRLDVEGFNTIPLDLLEQVLQPGVRIISRVVANLFHWSYIDPNTCLNLSQLESLSKYLWDDLGTYVVEPLENPKGYILPIIYLDTIIYLLRGHSYVKEA